MLNTLNILFVGRRTKRRRAAPTPPGTGSYLLTNAGNVICTATGNRIKLITSN